MMVFAGIAIFAIVLLIVVEANKTPEQRAQDLYGPKNQKLHCPHCQNEGQVRTKHVIRKKGVSGGKAAAAVLTGGVSILATGLSRKENETQAHCDNCNSTWFF